MIISVILSFELCYSFFVMIALLLIGNELLSGKTRDENFYYLSKAFASVGLALDAVSIIADEPQAIANEVKRLHPLYDHIITSGGIGPTHDDLTVSSIAKAFEVPLVRQETLAEQLRAYLKESCTEAHLRMADLPQGSTLVYGPSSPWPVFGFKNFFILPGVPQAFRKKLDLLLETDALGARVQKTLVVLEAMADEGTIADDLTQIAERFPEVSIGSYPIWEDGSHNLKLTFEGEDASLVNEAASASKLFLGKRFVREHS